MEFIFEFLFEAYLELMMYIVPEEKATSKRYRFLYLIIAFIILIGVLALFIWGIVLLERNNLKGLIPICLAIVLSIAQIVLGFIFHDRKTK